MNNILRIGKVNVIGDVILFLGKLCVSLFCALFAFLMLDTHKYKSAHNKISSPLVPVVVSWALGFIVAKLFFQVVEMSIDTIILSFCQDSEEHQGNAQELGDIHVSAREGVIDDIAKHLAAGVDVNMRGRCQKDVGVLVKGDISCTAYTVYTV
uniref:Choline transporter-like protein n=1 Tax=Oryza glumipatula TaxID=40148 RepID=A0A0D9ZSK8_9ORYZ